MTWDIVAAAGGLGLFLIGMMIMTEGLHGVAGASLGAVLRRFTRSPASGAVTGALVTAVVQSSSATTVSAVGFAGAGVLTFPEALGIVFGANVGTTVTGWMVALFGLKLDLGLVMPLVVLAGALLRLLGRGRIPQLGTALAGFGLLFIGIDALRNGMAGLQGVVTPADFPADDVLGRVRLVGIGIAITVVTQSSSAGVATALVALDSGAIGLQQAAGLVIGMNVGTTVTAALATIGAPLAARRTGWAHVLFNVGVASAAFLMLPFFFAGLESALPGVTTREPELALVGFHTWMNVIGVLVVLPFSREFARLVERMVPDRPTPFTQRLDRALLPHPELALRAVAPTLGELAGHGLTDLRELLSAARGPHRERVDLIELALDEVRRYIARMSPAPSGSPAEARRLAALHVIDQLRRLLNRERQSQRAAAVVADAKLRGLAGRLIAILPGAGETLEGREGPLGELCRELGDERPAFREAVLRGAETTGALEQLDAYRWLERVAHHVWRIAHHLEQLGREVPTPLVSEPPEPD